MCAIGRAVRHSTPNGSYPGEVLQKFTVDAVRPVLSSNRDQIKAVADKIAEEQQKKEQALAEFISKHNIRIQN